MSGGAEPAGRRGRRDARSQPGHTPAWTSFAILDFPDPGDADVVYAENATGGLFLEKDEELNKYHEIFDALASTPLDAEESRRTLEMLMEEPLWRSRPRDSGST